MYNTFSFIGKIKPVKDTEKFKSYEEMIFDSGWTNRKVKFNMVCGTNRHLIQGTGGCYPDGSGKVYTQKQEVIDGKTKYSKYEIPFKNRFKAEYVENVANFAKFVVDTEIYGKRSEILHDIDKIKAGDKENIRFETLEDAEKALEKSKAKRKEFVSQWDFVEYVDKLVKNDKIKDVLFKVTGNVKFSYSKGNFYRTFEPTKIYRVSEDTAVSSEADLCVYYTDNAVDSSTFDDTGKYYVSAFCREYDNISKSLYGVPMTFVIDSNGDEKTQKRARGFNKIFTCDDGEYHEIGIKCTIVDGSQEVEITEEMLTDEQRENLDFGLVTMEEIKSELGGNAYGDRVQEIRIDGLVKGYTSGGKDTAYTSEDFGTPSSKKLEESTDDEVEDIFDEDSDDDIEI